MLSKMLSPNGRMPDVPLQNEFELDELLSAPSDADVEAAREWQGDLLVLGAGGKMGPSLVERAARAVHRAGQQSRVVAVSRFSDPNVRTRLESVGALCIASDLLEPGSLEALPEASNIIHMAARKFGTSGDASLTWATNVLLPGLVARRYRQSRIVTFSTGNVYPLFPAGSDGPDETVEPAPVGEYGQSALGRERLFEYASRYLGTPVSILRLNYAIEMRYGVLADIAWKVQTGAAVDLSMGYVNVIWQGDANSVALRSVAHCQSPPFVLNLTGREKLSVREIAERFGDRFGRRPDFRGVEAPTALLSRAARCRELFGPPSVPIDQMVDWVAEWVKTGGCRWEKPTHFEVRNGAF